MGTDANGATARGGAVPPLAKLRGALFDLDGTLCDSDPVHFKVFDELLRRTGVLPDGLTHDYFKANIAGGANADIFARAYPTKTIEEREKMADEKELAFRQALEREKLDRAAGLTALLDILDANGVQTIVVTNAPRANAEAMLKRLGLADYFGGARLVIGGECKKSKPDPEPYLEGLRRIGCENSPECCLAFEDSPAGARAAVAANIPTVGIMSSQAESALAEVGCVLCVKDFASTALTDALGIE